MSRKKNDESGLESSFDEAFEARLELAQRKYPDNVWTGGEGAARCICLPMPALAPRVLLRQEGWPMGRFCLLDGAQESGKSAFGYEVIRWHRRMRGKGKIIEIEDKQSPDLCLSINEYDGKATSSHFCDTMDEWQDALTYWIKDFITIMDGDPKAPKKSPGLGRFFPVCFMLDSIMAAVTEEAMEQVLKDGHATRTHPIHARNLSEYMKSFTKWLAEYPFTVIGVNHLKPTQDRRGFSVRHMPGGKSPGYHASLDIEMRRLSTDAVKRAGKNGQPYEYIPLLMKIQKNSTAPKGEVEVNMVYYLDLENRTESGECLQRTYFDWDSASIKCIFDAIGNGDAETARRLRDLTDLQMVNNQTKVVSSSVLGISEDDPLSFHEAGKVLETKIQQDGEFRDNLYPLLGIGRRYLFQVGRDYREQQQDAREQSIRTQSLREIAVRRAETHRPVTNFDSDNSGDLPLDIG